MKVKLLSHILIVALLSYQSAKASGIPTFDASSMLNQAKQLVQLKTQIENQISQISELKNQVTALTGTRNMGNLLKNTVKDAIPDEWQDIYNSAQVDTSKLTNGSGYTSGDNLKFLAKYQQMTESTFSDIKQRLNTIDSLQSEINNTKDLKASADLQNRIGTEQAAIANNQVKLDQLSRMYQVQQDVRREQRKAYFSCIAGTINHTTSNCDG